MVTLELAAPQWLLLLALLPLWILRVMPPRSWGVITPGSDEAEGVALTRWLGSLLEALPLALRAAAVACLIVALARPQLVGTTQESVLEGVGVVLAIDLSTSMWAQDMADGADRLDIAKATLQRFLELRTGDVGLVSFAGEALTRLPLTSDRFVVRSAVDALEVGLLVDGTDIAGAIATAGALLRDSPYDSKVLILVTDGAHNRAGMLPTHAARAAAAYDIRIYPVAIGSDEAAGVGTVAMETVLTSAASITGGRYFRATDADALDGIYEEIDRLTEPTQRIVDRVEVTPVGFWAIVAGMALLLVGSGIRASRFSVVP